MNYKLINGRGVLIDSTPVFKDVKSTFEIFVTVPKSNSSYIAVMTGEDGVRHRKKMKNGHFTVAYVLLQKEQTVQLEICEMDGAKIKEVFTCEPFAIRAFHNSAASLMGVCPAADPQILKRLVALESLVHEQAVKITELQSWMESKKRRIL